MRRLMRIAKALLLFLVVLTVGIFQSGCGQPPNTVLVPPTDTTPPTAGISIYFNATIAIPPLNVLSTSGPVTYKIPDIHSKLTIIARGDDPNGMRTIQISVVAIPCFGIVCVPTIPGDLPPPNTDPNAQPGGYATTSRLIAYNIDVSKLAKGASSLSIIIGATATNAHGLEASTAIATLKWPYPGQVTPWAVVMCKFADLPNVEPQNAQYFQNFVTEAGANQGGLFDYWRDMSYGTLDLTGSKVFGWFTMTHTRQWYLDEGKTEDIRLPVIQDCLNAAESSVTFSPYWGVLVVLNASLVSGAAAIGRIPFTLNGVTQMYGAVVLDPLAWNVTFAAHEMGHAYGLQHSFDTSGRICSLGAAPGEYCDSWDIMSALDVWSYPGQFGSSGCPQSGNGCISGPGLNAAYRYELGWIPPSAIYTFTGNQPAIITLAALDHPEESVYRMVIIPLSDNPKHYLTVEFRTKDGWNRGIPRDTVLIHEVKPDGRSFLIVDDGGPERQPGQTYQDTTYNIRITVESIDSTSSTAIITIQRPF